MQKKEYNLHQMDEYINIYCGISVYCRVDGNKDELVISLQSLWVLSPAWSRPKRS